MNISINSHFVIVIAIDDERFTYDLIDIFYDHGVDINICDSGGDTPIFLCEYNLYNF